MPDEEGKIGCLSLVDCCVKAAEEENANMGKLRRAGVPRVQSSLHLPYREALGSLLSMEAGNLDSDSLREDGHEGRFAAFTLGLLIGLTGMSKYRDQFVR